MADTIDKAHITKFKLDYEHAVQQMLKVTGETVTIDQHEGKRKRYTIQNELDYVAYSSRLQSTTGTEAQYDFRWLLTAPYTLTPQWDRDDEFLLAEMQNPRSSLMQGLVYGYNRLCDDVVITSLGAAAVTGEDGTGSTAYAGQSIAVNAVESGSAVNSGLTLGKMRLLRKAFLDDNVDPGQEIVWLIGPAQLQDLQTISEYQSLDYNSKRALVTGQPTPFLGFTFKVSTRLPVASDVRTTYAYTKRSMILNPGVRDVVFSERADLRHARQIFSYARLGSMRLHDDEVGRVYCSEA